MKLIRRFLISFVCCINTLHSAGPSLVIGVESYNPPFEFQSGRNSLYGFDIEMLNHLCKIMQRTCTYRLMRFDRLLTAVANNKIDIAASSITITAERSKKVSFTLPYVVSYSRFLARKGSFHQAFNYSELNNQKIGIESGTIFDEEIHGMGIKNPNIKLYANVEDLLEGLSVGDVKYVLVDNPTAVFWEANSAEEFRAIGTPLPFGFGYGFAINLNNKPLLNAMNKALLQYQNSPDYIINYNKYMPQF